MKVWLDDVRVPPGKMVMCLDGSYFEQSEWVWVKTAAEAINLLKTGQVTHISLDHDLGNDEYGTGYDVARFIEEEAHYGKLNRLEWLIHSQNPVGCQNMTHALAKADEYWER